MLPPREEEEAVLIESGVITPTPSSPSQTHDERQLGEASSAVHIDTSSGPLRQLLDETADLIDSPIFTRIHTLLLGSMFSNMVDAHVIAQAFPQQRVHSPSSSPSGAQQPRIQELDSAVTVVPGEPRVKLASLLAIITRQAHAIGNGNNPPNEYISTAEAEVKELEAFAALIYASNLDQNLEERQSASSDEGIKVSAGTGVSEVGTEHVDEMIESKLESAWTKVTGSTFQPK